MGRLTGRNEKGELLLCGNIVYGNDQDIYNAVSALEEYEDAEGLLVRLPCKVGTKLFGVAIDGKHIISFIADDFIYHNGYWMVMGTHGEGEFDWQDCYLTEKEAEAALKGDNNRA